MIVLPRRSVPTAIVAVTVASVVLIAVGLGLTRFTPRLVWGGGFMSSGFSRDLQGSPYTYGDMNPCVSRGSVTVVKIEPTKSAGLMETGWGSRLNPFEHGVTSTGAEDGGGKVSTVTQAGFRTGPRTLHDLCRDRTPTGNAHPNDYEFAVELRRTGAATGWSNGLTVTYRSGGKTHTSRWPMNFVLCGNTTPSYPDPSMNDLCGP